MVKTANLELPLVQAAQAQKHVTVNEALALLDAAAQLRLASINCFKTNFLLRLRGSSKFENRTFHMDICFSKMCW